MGPREKNVIFLLPFPPCLGGVHSMAPPRLPPDSLALVMALVWGLLPQLRFSISSLCLSSLQVVEFPAVADFRIVSPSRLASQPLLSRM